MTQAESMEVHVQAKSAEDKPVDLLQSASSLSRFQYQRSGADSA
jgi:hypothetical protein